MSEKRKKSIVRIGSAGAICNEKKQKKLTTKLGEGLKKKQDGTQKGKRGRGGHSSFCKRVREDFGKRDHTSRWLGVGGKGGEN